MSLPRFTYEERLAEGGVRRKWFDVEHNSIPPVFYLPLYPLVKVDPLPPMPEVTKLRVARYERVGRRHFPYPARGMDVYEYKGDEFR